MHTKVEKFPVTINRHGHTVRIYRIKNRGRTMFQTCHRIGKKRMLKNFVGIAAARAHANTQADLLSAGSLVIAGMDSADRDTFNHASQLLQPLGVTIMDAARAYVAAIKALPDGASLSQAVKYYADHHTAQTKRKTVPDVVREFLAAKKDDELSDAYLKTLRSMLAPNEPGAKTKHRKSFAESFQTYIDSVKTAEMDAWLRARGVGARRRRNITLVLRDLFSSAQSMGYLPKATPTEADGLTLPKKKGGDIGIFTPAELRALFTGSKAHPLNEEYKLWLAIGAFSGIRTAEMLRLKWSEHVQVEKGQIVIAGNIAKTASRRIIRMPANLSQWLADCAGRTGKVFEPRADERAHRYASRLGVPWKPNALRHSFISYAVAQRKDIPAVSYEAGNSPAIIKTHYMKLVDESAAAEWFAIAPAS